VQGHGDRKSPSLAYVFGVGPCSRCHATARVHSRCSARCLRQGIHTWLEGVSLSASPAGTAEEDAGIDAAPAPADPPPAGRHACAFTADEPACALAGTPFETWPAGSADGWASDAEFASDDFDSGAETEREEGSDVTVMCDSD